MTAKLPWGWLLFFMCMLFGDTVLAEVPAHTVGMYNEEPFTVEQERFYPSDKIYAVVDFANIQAGTYELNIDWILPSGKLVKQDIHTLTLSEDTG